MTKSRPRKTGGATKPITVMLPWSVVASLDRVAAVTNDTRGRLMRVFILQGLEKIQNKLNKKYS